MQFSDSSCKDYTYSAGILLNFCNYEECTQPNGSKGFCSYIYTCDGSTATENTYYSQDCTGTLKSSNTNPVTTECSNTYGYNVKYACIAATSGAPLPSNSVVLEYYDDSSCSQQPYSFYGIANGICQSDSNSSGIMSCDSSGFSYTHYDDSECSGPSQSAPPVPIGSFDCVSADDGNDYPSDDTYVMKSYIQPTCTTSNGASSAGLSAGAIAGIAIGTIAVVAAIGFGVYFWLFKYRTSVLDTDKSSNMSSSIKRNPMSSSVNEL
jgi:hypothetical protein